MGSNAFSDFINDCQITDDANCSRSEIDMRFITVNLSGPKVRISRGYHTIILMMIGSKQSATGPSSFSVL